MVPPAWKYDSDLPGDAAAGTTTTPDLHNRNRNNNGLTQRRRTSFVLDDNGEDTDLFLRHRSPAVPAAAAVGKGAAVGSKRDVVHDNDETHDDRDAATPSDVDSLEPSRHRQEINRIRTDRAQSVLVRHDVPIVDEEATTTELDHVNDNEEDTKSDHGGGSPDNDDDNDNDTHDTDDTNDFSFLIRASKRAGISLVGQLTPGRHQGWDKYSLESLRKDVTAGITVAVLAVPLSMSYAKLAGLPPYYGLYTSLTPPLIYPLWGTSRQVSVGPAALVSLLIGAGVSQIVTDEGLVDGTSAYLDRYTSLAVQCSFLAGMINMAMGFLRLGFVTQFLSQALISGFTSGAAIVIAVSQVKYLFGYYVHSSTRLDQMISSLLDDIDQFNWKTFTMGSVCIVFLVIVKHISVTYPKYKWIKALGPITVTVIGIALVYIFNLQDHGIVVVGAIPPGLPSVTVKDWTPIESKIFSVAIAIAIVGFVQTYAIAKKIAYDHGYEIDASQEFIGLGLANLIGGVFQAYPASGCLGQSAVNNDIGAQTGLASVTTAAAVMLVLLFMTPVFEKLPLCVLAAIVMAYVLTMFDYVEAIYLYKVHKFDFVIWMTAFLGTVLLGVEYGLAIAVGVSLLIVIYESVNPRTAILGRLPGTILYRNIKQYRDAERYDGLLIIRIDVPLYFANAQNIRDKIRKYKRVTSEELAQRNAGEVRYIILDLSPVSHIDTSGLHMLEDMYTMQKKWGAQICFANPGIAVMKKFSVCGIVDLVGREHIFSGVIDAVEWCLREMDKAASSRLMLLKGNDGDEESRIPDTSAVMPDEPEYVSNGM